MNSDFSISDKITKTFSIAAALFGAVLLFSSGQAVAQDTGSATADSMLEEIVVTARRREERLLDQPLSIAAITGEQMQVQGIYSVDHVTEFVPNVTLATSERANNTRVIIRGIGGGFPDPVFVFGSGMYIDGHYIPTSLGGYMSTLDIERIELLRGPQGTLFGKNVIGGAVNIISVKPQADFDSSVLLRVTDDSQQDVRAMVNIPFSDTFYGRFSAASETYDGYYENRHLGIDVGFHDRKSFRGALRWQPSEQWTWDVSAAISRREDDNAGGQCIGPGANDDAPQWGGGAGNLERRLYTGAEADYFALCAADVAAGEFVNSSDKVTFSDVDEETIFLAGEWSSAGAVGGMDSLDIRGKFSYRNMEYTYFGDRDYTSWPVDGIGTYGSRGQNNETYGFELVLDAQQSDRLSWVVGVNFFDETALNGEDLCWNDFVASGAPGDVDANGDANDPAQISITCQNKGLHFELVPDNPTGTDIHPGQDPDLWPNAPRINPFGPGPFLGEVSVFNQSVGIFGHMTYAFNDKWTMDLGGRYTRDEREFHNIEFASTGCDVSVDPTGHCTFTLPVSLFHVNDTGFFNTAEDTFTDFSPTLSLTRNLSPGDTLHGGMFYFLYSEGFLTGGFNTEINSNLPAVEPLLAYEPENVKNYEIGFKGQFMDGNVQIMADIFYMDYTNQQKQIDLANPDNEFGAEDPVGIITNVGESTITGVEFELRAAFWEGGYISLDVGYLDNKIEEYSFPDPADPTQIVDLSNVHVNDFTPDWTVNAAIEHDFTFGNGGTLTPRAVVYWQSEFEWASTTGDWSLDAPDSGCHQSAYAKLDARVSYAPQSGDWNVAAIGGNLTDERYISYCSTSRSVWLRRYARPRWFGLEFSMHFGRK